MRVSSSASWLCCRFTALCNKCGGVLPHPPDLDWLRTSALKGTCRAHEFVW